MIDEILKTWNSFYLTIDNVTFSSYKEKEEIKEIADEIDPCFCKSVLAAINNQTKVKNLVDELYSIYIEEKQQGIIANNQIKDNLEKLQKFFNSMIGLDFYLPIEEDELEAVITTKREIKECIDKEYNLNYKNIFPENDISNIDISKLGADTEFNKIIQSRFNEIQITIENKAPLATIVLCGSVLEGILLSVAKNNMKVFNRSSSVPKDKSGNNKNISNWTLEDLINVSHNIDLIDISIKEFSKSLKEFRNYIHPRKQIETKFNPTDETADICYRVMIGAIKQIIDNQSKIQDKNNAETKQLNPHKNLQNFIKMSDKFNLY